MAKKKPSKEIIAKSTITRRYGPHGSCVLLALGYLKEIEAKTKPRSYTVQKPLPDDKKEFDHLAESHYTTTVGNLVSDAYSEIECIHDELSEWYSNMPDSFQGSDKGQELEEAISTLSNHTTEPDLDGSIGRLMLVHIPRLDVGSRQKRINEAAESLLSVLNLLEEIRESEETLKEAIAQADEEAKKKMGKRDKKQEWFTKIYDIQAHAEEISSTLGDAISDLENVDVPGMY